MNLFKHAARRVATLAGPALPAWHEFAGKTNFAILRGDGYIRVVGLQDFTLTPNRQVEFNSIYDGDKAILVEREAGYIRDKRVLDIGCHAGLFLLKAMEWGAREATGWDISRERVSLGAQIAQLTGLGDQVHLEQRDFWDHRGSADTVFAFGLVHHLAFRYPGRSLKAALCHLSEYEARTFFVEWIGPRDRSVAKLARKYNRDPRTEDYAREPFEEGLRRYIGDARALGPLRHHHYGTHETERQMYLVTR